ncbi:MAG: AAA family ATPase [Muribaculaceae bacterium]|nr:AAA family ATPase [Muribaculaceae bacterium]
MKRPTKKLAELELRGFKSIAYDKPLNLQFGAVNILLGANGAGKSNIISFFKMLSYMATGAFQQYVAQYGTSEIFLHYGAKKTPALSASLRFDGNNCYDLYSFCLANAVPNRLIVASEEIKWKSRNAKTDSPGIKQLKSDFNESALVSSSGMTEKSVLRLVSGCKVYQFSDSSSSAPMRLASTVESAHYLQSEANNLASFLYYLKQHYLESYRRIVSYVREVVPQFHDFYLEPENKYISLKWIDVSPNDYVLSAHQFSDGSIRFIALATLLLQPEETMPHVIIIDEPELGLHPYAIDQLTEMIKDASLHAQIIVATQSPAIIDGFSANDVTIIERDAASQSSIARKLNAEDYKEWLNEYTLSELWDKNIIGGRPV